ncbi:CoA-disulfide reductase [Azotosporobacter soli]|uniref:CoA-disulfide reductase n=1 Tax=Azotosporobacter soli TaxID=3055040 RepID=UPI0031FEA70C
MRFIIIGGEAAGMSAAAKLRRMVAEAEIVMYEKSEVVSFGACGLPYYVGDYFDDPDYMVSRTAQQMSDSGIQMRTGHQVLQLDSRKKTLQVQELGSGKIFEDHYDKVMIATGATAMLPPIGNIALENVFTLKSLADGQALKALVRQASVRNVVIIGAGYIGLELAEAMHKQGKEVRMIQLDDRVLPDSFDPEITDLMEAELRSQGVQLHVAETVERLQGETAVSAVVTNKGAYPADLVVVCTGVKPQTRFLSENDLRMLPNGAIWINDLGETSLPDVYAAGDCASVHHLVSHKDVYIPLATTANRIGRIVGENMAGGKQQFPGTLGTAAVKVMELAAGRTGITEAEAKKMGISCRTVFVKDKDHSNYLPNQEEIFLKLIYECESKRILGAQIAGREASILRINALAMAVAGGVTTKELGMMDFFYAPPFSRPWDIMNIAGNAAK